MPFPRRLLSLDQMRYYPALSFQESFYDVCLSDANELCEKTIKREELRHGRLHVRIHHGWKRKLVHIQPHITKRSQNLKRTQGELTIEEQTLQMVHPPCPRQHHVSGSLLHGHHRHGRHDHRMACAHARHHRPSFRAGERASAAA